MQGDRARLAVVLGLAMAIACDAPVPEEDAGTDGGNVDPDAGRDGGRDAGGGGDCQGPPGLYSDGACEIIAPGVRAYRPRYVLWSDDADKERYIYLPPGTRIDTTDPDNWIFPTGTIIYKTFLHDGVRLETRVLQKHGSGTGPASWYMRAYAWNAAQDRVTEVQDADISVRSNVLGTQHDIPSQAQCIECHSGVLDTSNSFSAIQLNHDLGGLTLEMLRDEGLLTTPITLEAARVPDTMGGGAADPVAEAALGYLHANCGNCHRHTPGAPSDCLTPACRSGLRMWVDVGTASIDATDTWTTAVGVRGTFFDPDAPNALCRIHPGASGTSTVIFRMMTRGDSSQMPPIGTELAHPEGITAISTWIAALTADATDCVP